MHWQAVIRPTKRTGQRSEPEAPGSQVPLWIDTRSIPLFHLGSATRNNLLRGPAQSAPAQRSQLLPWLYLLWRTLHPQGD